MPEREESDRSHPPAASPQPQNRRQRAAPAQHESFVSTERRCPATTSRRRPVPAQHTSVDQPPATEPPGRSQNVSTWTSEGRSESRRIGGAAAQRGSPGHDAKDCPGSGLCQLAPPGRHQQPEWRGSQRGDPNHRAAEASRGNGGNTGASRDNGARGKIGARCHNGDNNGKSSVSNGGRGYSGSGDDGAGGGYGGCGDAGGAPGNAHDRADGSSGGHGLGHLLLSPPRGRKTSSPVTTTSNA
ncbi:hypothetical protein HPB50_018873 [Hyalomma asiaticum]|uniref:Uncharacterized protein n=1 Tax=Hyalomma asiaticum TaxID=266040 RepID=A0ACB7RU76_HYAAI|nr:hypothetical protein HPB50_018873 [Hyalomma asiaticum]